MKPIAFIPHKRRLEKHKLEYLKAINEALDYPYQSEDGRDLSPIQQKLYNKCVDLSGLEYWHFTDCCTDALQVAIHCLTDPNSTIAVPAYGWRAFANAVKFMNRQLNFIDVDSTGNICLSSLREYCTSVKNPPQAIIVVHNFGTIVNCTEVRKVLDDCGLLSTCIIEDAAPAFYMGEPYSYKPGYSSEAVCYSFDFTKYPGTLGSGGAIASKFKDINDRIYLTLSHGRQKNGAIVTFGTKSYMDNTSCAVLLKEIEIFETNDYRKIRNHNATWFNKNLPYKSVPGDNYAWERYTMKVPEGDVASVINELNKVGCLAKTFFKEPLHKFSFFEDFTNCPNTEKFVKTTVMLPCHHYLNDEEKERIAKALTNVG